MKKWFLIIILAVLILPRTVSAASVDHLRESSLAIQYKHNEDKYSDLEIETYQIARIEEHGIFVLSEMFHSYPVKVNGVKTQEEWKTVLSTLESYIVADQIPAAYVQTTDSDGIVHFGQLVPGIYLTLGENVENEKETVIFESFLTVIPHPNGDGTYNYDLLKIPKWTFFQKEPEPEPIAYSVVKQWNDYGMEEERPEQITIDIYKEDTLVTTEELKPDTDWTYRWEAPDDGAKWYVVEREGGEGYTVSSVLEGNTFVITNTKESQEEMPQTGDTTVIWPYILGLCGSGMLFIILAIWRKRKE